MSNVSSLATMENSLDDLIEFLLGEVALCPLGESRTDHARVSKIPEVAVVPHALFHHRHWA